MPSNSDSAEEKIIVLVDRDLEGLIPRFMDNRRNDIVTLGMAVARVSCLRPARLRRMASPATDRAHSRMQANAGRPCRRNADREARRRSGLADSSSEATRQGQSMGLLELVRLGDFRGPRRGGDRCRADTRGPARVSGPPSPDFRRRPLRRRVPRFGPGSAPSKDLRGCLHAFRDRMRSGVGPDGGAQRAQARCRYRCRSDRGTRARRCAATGAAIAVACHSRRTRRGRRRDQRHPARAAVSRLQRHRGDG